MGLDAELEKIVFTSGYLRAPRLHKLDGIYDREKSHNKSQIGAESCTTSRSTGKGNQGGRK